MAAKNEGVSARLYLDLEEGPEIFTQTGQPRKGVHSRLEVEGDEEAAFQVADQIMAVVAFRGSGVAKHMYSWGASLMSLGLAVAVAVLFAVSLFHWPGPRAAPWPATIGLILVLVLAVVGWYVFAAGQTILWPGIQIEGWRRLEKTRSTIQ